MSTGTSESILYTCNTTIEHSSIISFDFAAARSIIPAIDVVQLIRHSLIPPSIRPPRDGTRIDLKHAPAGHAQEQDIRLRARRAFPHPHFLVAHVVIRRLCPLDLVQDEVLGADQRQLGIANRALHAEYFGHRQHGGVDLAIHARELPGAVDRAVRVLVPSDVLTGWEEGSPLQDVDEQPGSLAAEHRAERGGGGVSGYGDSGCGCLRQDHASVEGGRVQRLDGDTGAPSIVQDGMLYGRGAFEVGEERRVDIEPSERRLKQDVRRDEEAERDGDDEVVRRRRLPAREVVDGVGDE